MATEFSGPRMPRARRLLACGAATASAAALLAGAPTAGAHMTHRDFWWHETHLVPGSVVVSGSTFPRSGVDITAGTTVLPTGVTAVADGTYPQVFNNDGTDGSFAVNTPVDLWDLAPWGGTLGRIQAPTDQVTTSFSSKSEEALNLSSDGRDLSLLGYDAAPGDLDVSNSNTPGVFDPTNPDPGSYYRVAATLGADGHWSFTDTNAFSGDNGRAAVLNNTTGDYYAAGNSNNGSTDAVNPDNSLDQLGLSAGAQVFPFSGLPQSAQSPGLPTQLANFNASIVPGFTGKNKQSKDNNFRGLTEYNGVVYYTKGSGSNGINTVYFVDTTNSACPTGVGLPVPGAPLPTATGGPYTLCVLNGFNTTTAKKTTDIFPFGIWFANPDTLYVADEGDGTATYDPTTGTYTDAAGQTMAGLQKWVFNGTQWNLAYTIQAGLNLGKPYTVPGYPTGDNITDIGGTTTDNGPWAPATDGLRNISGRVNRDGTATIYAVTSTVSGSGDQGADPNAVVAVTDELGAGSPGVESFHVIRAPRYGEVYRGVAVLPDSYGFGHGFDGRR